MNRECEHCAMPFDAATIRARYCSDSCRGRARREREARGIPAPARVPGGPLVQPTVDTTRTQLEATDRQDTVAGAVALVLAARIDSGRDTGASLAALAREYRATLLWALEGITPEADALDELRRRREVRAARATGRRP